MHRIKQDDLILSRLIILQEMSFTVIHFKFVCIIPGVNAIIAIN